MMAQNAAGKMTILPAGTTLYVQRRAFELAGAALALMALVLALALVSFSADDPSLNNATQGFARNLLGLPGAYVADIVLQTIGTAGGVLCLVLVTWGWRVLSHRGLPWVWLNLAALPVALTAVAVVLAAVAAPQNWPLAGGLGGWIGDVLFRMLVNFGQSQGLVVEPLYYLFGLVPLALLALAATVGLDRHEWQALAAGSFGFVVRGWRLLWGLGHAGEFIENQKTKHAERVAERTAKRAAAKLASTGPAGGGLRERLEPTLTGAPIARAYDADDDVRDDAGEAAEMINIKAPAVSVRAASKRVASAAKSLRSSKRADAEKQPALDLGLPGENGNYQLPPLSLLAGAKGKSRGDMVSEDALEQNARLLESVLADFGVHGDITKVRPGPVVTLYELEPAPGTKTSRVIGLANDIARSMSARSVRVAVVPGRNAIGIEMPNSTQETVYLRELLGSEDYESTVAKLTLALGKDIGGDPVIADLARMPHLLIAGTTGSGKSVGVNSMILSLLYRLPPEQCRLILIDPKMLELSVYNDIPHLLTPVVTEPGKAVVALKWAVREMENRYRAMSQLGVRNVMGYNQRLAEAAARGEEIKRTVQTGFDPETGEPIYEDQSLDLSPLPFIVIVVDEMADLMMVAGKDIEASVQRLAQMARAAGIHLIMATQRPSVDVITGTIKANFPTRIAFQVTSKIDSRTILGEQGAEQLLGSGDMLFMEGGGRIKRVHGPFVSDREVEKIVKALKKQGRPDYLDGITDDVEGGSGMSGVPGMTGGSGGGGEELYDQAVALVCREQRASTSFVQRHLQIGYNRAARIIEQMEREGVISAANRVGKRDVLARDIDAME
jgi:S-DNA-T family DNA segregation ATPase FtsK/SpoIIIE